MRRVVCAAIRGHGGVIICGARHFDGVMLKQLDMAGGSQHFGRSKPVEQGFIDNRGEWLTREEALVVATAAGQLVRRCPGDDRELFSENLY